ELAPYRPIATFAEIQRILKKELDFTRELRNLHQFAARFRRNTAIRIPQPVDEYCTSKVLTMEFLEGTRIAQLDEVRNGDVDWDSVARRGAEAYLQMIFRHGSYHADPHPGNLVILPGDVIGLLDFGMVGRIDDELRDHIEEALLAIAQGDSARLAEMITRIGKPQAATDVATFRADLAEFVSLYANQPLDQLDLSRVLTEMTEIIYRYKISLPPQVGMLIKTLISLEGTSRLLSSRFSLMEVLQPFQKQALLRRFSPARRIKKIRRALLEFEHLATEFPRRTLQLLEQAREGELNIRLEHRRLGPSVNRLVLGLLASALFLGSALMLSQKVPPLLFRGARWWGLENLSVLGLAGCGLSILLSVRLLWAIGKSGHLDRRE
ncbi:MAG TPA: AarF/UbiB family protein, partial [Pirellulaceae bacterium]